MKRHILSTLFLLVSSVLVSCFHASLESRFYVSQAGENGKTTASGGNENEDVLDPWGEPVDVSRLPASLDRPVNFSSEIKPIFEHSCVDCHGPQRRPKSGFRLDIREGAMKGGELGVAIFPGQSHKSPLIHYTARLVEEMEMPPEGEGEPLSPAQVALLRAWIDQGAKWDEETTSRTLPPADTRATPAAAVTDVVLPPPASKKVDFIHEVGPLLVRCHTCHGSEKQRGGLRLDLRETALKGGDSGPAIIPGNSAESRMIRFVTGIPSDMLMPRQGPRLTEDEIGLLRAWIDQGASWPDDYDPSQYTRSPADHWAYRPLVRPEIPGVQDPDWPRSPIDRFILAKLEEKGLRPSPPADKRTLLRRLTLDLTGLQPTPEEYQDFFSDDSADAWEKVVDRLLASPHYGERWARHWMDAVHYAESHGLEEDLPRDNAWPYRDYLIRSFNEDKPYPRFVEEQLAGDVLYPLDPQATVATGFIAAGPFDHSAMTGPPSLDTKQAQNLDRDDMLMTTLSAFTSTTIHCARCHDHKFDPITQTEYYNLQSVFAGIDRGDRPYDPDPELHALRQPLLQRKLNLEGRTKEIAELAAALQVPEMEQLDERLKALEEELSARAKPIGDILSPTSGYRSEIGFPGDAPKWVQLDLGKPFPIDQILLMPVEEMTFGPDGPPQEGFGFPRRFRIDLSNDVYFSSFQTVADESRADLPNPGIAPHRVKAGGTRGRYLRLTVFPPDEENFWFFALSELLVYSGKQNVALGTTATARDAIGGTGRGGKARWAPENLVDGYTSRVSLSSLGLDPESPSDGYQSELAALPDSQKWVQVHLGKSVPIDEVRLIPVVLKEGAQAAGFGFPVRFQVEASDQADFQESRLLADYTTADFPNPGESPIVLTGPFGTAHFVRVRATKLASIPEGHALALAEMQVISEGRNVAASSVVSALDSTELGRWGRAFLVDNYTSREGIGELPEALNSVIRWQEIDQEIDQLKKERTVRALSLLDQTRLTELEQIDRDLETVQERLTALPPSEMVYAGTPDFAPFHRNVFPTKGRPRPVFVLERGDITRPGQPAVPAGLSLVPLLDPQLPLEDPDNEGSRRAALAQWISDPRNVLTWRSIVNRVWHYHFDQGIVDTPNDLGHMGGDPSHPELLDWLAAWFLENGGSLKKLHKLILMTSVYRQSAGDNPEYSKIDAGNRFLWRMNRRRLAAEEVRDTVLQASGKLDRTMGGPPARQFKFENPRPPVTPLIDYETFDVDSPEMYRRSVYRYVYRTRPDPFMEALDFPDTAQLTATRNVSTTAPHALALWNNPFMLRQSEHLAERVAREAGADPAAQIAAAFERVLGRVPTPRESQDFQTYAAQHGVINACRVLFNSNEFLFVD